MIQALNRAAVTTIHIFPGNIIDINFYVVSDTVNIDYSIPDGYTEIIVNDNIIDSRRIVHLFDIPEISPRIHLFIFTLAPFRHI